MPNERIITPILGARFDPGHPQAQGLRHAWLLNEGAGRAVNDAVGGRAGALVADPLWERRGAETGVALVTASSQYVDLGDVELLDGATKFTMVARMYRASSADNVELQKGTSQFARTAIQWRSTGSFFFTTATTTDQWGAVTDTSTGVHTFAMAFDGTQTTNATRLKGYYDGIPQTLTFTGTIPAATASTADPFRLGHAPHGLRFSQGTVFYVFIYDRALSAEEIAAVTLDPYAPWRAGPPRLAYPSPVVVESPSADVSCLADDLVAINGLFATLPAADITLEANDLVALGEVDRELPLVTIAMDAIAPFTTIVSSPAQFSNVSPTPDAAGYRGADRVTVDVTSIYPVTQPVVEGSITISVDGVSLAVSTSTISAGFRATAPYLWNDEQTYEVEITAETTSTAGSPAVLTYTFTVGFWVTSPVELEGVAGAVRSGRLALDGSVSVAEGLSPVISGNNLHVADNLVRLDGSVGTALDLLRSGEVAILDGWVTLYVIESLLFASIGPLDGFAESVDLSIEAWDPVAGVAGLEADLDVYSVDGHLGLEASIEIREIVYLPAELAIGPIDPIAEGVDLSIDVDGYAASGMVVIDSPSAEWTSEEEAEDA